MTYQQKAIQKLYRSAMPELSENEKAFLVNSALEILTHAQSDEVLVGICKVA